MECCNHVFEYVKKEEFEAYKEQRYIAEGVTLQVILNNQKLLYNSIQALTDVIKMHIEKILEQIPEINKEYLKIETTKKLQKHKNKRKELYTEHYAILKKLNLFEDYKTVKNDMQS